MSATKKIKAEALMKAALQATARAMHTAQLAQDAYSTANATPDATALAAGLRDRLLDAYVAVGDTDRARLLATKATITSDELIDLLAMCIKG